MKERIIEILAEEFGIDKSIITPEKHIINDLNMDSLSVVQAIMNIEEEFNVEIPEEDIEKIETVADLIKYIESREK